MKQISPQTAYNIKASIRMWHFQKHISDMLISIGHDYNMAIREKIIQDSQLQKYKFKKVTDI